MNDQAIMENLLLTTKGVCDLYMHGTVESATQNVHHAFDTALSDSLNMQEDIYKQMTANPRVEIAACKKDGHWLRYTGKAVFETDDKYAQMMIKAAGLEEIYNDKTGYKLMTFHLEDAEAVDIAVMGEGESLL